MTSAGGELRPLRHAGAPFRAIHDALVAVEIDWSGLDPSAFADDVLAAGRAAWVYRVETEFRSIQVMTRFLTEVLASGDPLEVYAGAADAVVDEIRHTALCVGVAEALGVQPLLPDALEETDTPAFLALPMPQRALGTAISMLAVSETLSVALIEDLRGRCAHPVVRAVLDATIADEDAHQGFGWAYVAASLARFDGEATAWGRAVVATTLGPHLEGARAIVARMPEGRRRLDAWPEPELAALGVMSSEREALVKLACYEDVLAPRLRSVSLL